MVLNLQTFRNIYWLQKQVIVKQTQSVVEILNVALVCTTIVCLLKKFTTAFIVFKWKDFANGALKKSKQFCFDFYVAFDTQFSKNGKLNSIHMKEVNIVQNKTSLINFKTWHFIVFGFNTPKNRA